MFVWCIMEWNRRRGLWNKARQDVTSCRKCIRLQQTEQHQRDGERERVNGERDHTLLFALSCIPIFLFNHSCLQVWLTVSLRFPVSLSHSFHPFLHARSPTPSFMVRPFIHPSSCWASPSIHLPAMRLKTKFTKDHRTLHFGVSGQVCVCETGLTC